MSPREAILERALVTFAGRHVLEYVLEHGDTAFVAAQESRVATVVFVDIAGFSEPPGGIAAERVFEWQSRYLGAIAKAVLELGGTLDIFVGDSVCAWWADQPTGDEAIRACEASGEIARAIDQLNEAAAEQRYPVVQIGIAIHTDRVAIGPYGSKERLRFGIIGDGVNVAAKLRGAAPECPIVVSESTRQHLGPSGNLRAVRNVQIKGRSAPLEIYALDWRR